MMLWQPHARGPNNDPVALRLGARRFQTERFSAGGSERVPYVQLGDSKMRYRLAPLFCRPWTLNGITPRLIESHYEINYGGALNRLNEITRELELLDPGATPDGVINRLKRDELMALNSTLLHELYFASLGG